MTDDIFDFGFTAVTEDELEYSQKAVAKAVAVSYTHLTLPTSDLV